MVGLLLIDCWTCISCAMSFGFVRMLLYLPMRQSNEGVSVLLKIFLFIFLGLLS